MRWGVVSTVNEPDPLVLAFVAACLARGAAEVRLFVDVPQPTLQAALAGVPGVVVTVCDAAYWARAPKGRPWPQDARQRYNLRRGYAEADVEWILHIDADEVLHAPSDVGAALAALPPNVVSALVRVAERVHLGPADPHDIFDGVFRLPHDGRLQAEVDRIDGASARFLDRGMTGYPSGKSFVRTGLDLDLDIHGPNGVPAADRAGLEGFLILHFDGLTPRSWIRKKRRVLGQKMHWRSFPIASRRHQLEEVADRGEDEDRLVALYRQIKELDPARAAALGALGLIARPSLDLRADLARTFPGRAVDLGVAAYDRLEPGYIRVSRWARLRFRVRRALGALRGAPGRR